MTKIEIKEEGGCELYTVYINGKKVIDIGQYTNIDVNEIDGDTKVQVNGVYID